MRRVLAPRVAALRGASASRVTARVTRRYPRYSGADGLRLLLARHLVPLYDHVLTEMAKTGEAVAPLTGIFKRLYDVKNYTGVYKERFTSGDGRINGDADNRTGRYFKGNTNTGTDEVIHDISVLMRPTMHGGGTALANVNHISHRRKIRDVKAEESAASPSGGSPRGRGARSVSPRRRLSRTSTVDGGASVMSGAGASSPPARAAPPPMAPDTDALIAAMAAARSGNAEALCALTMALARQVQDASAGAAAAAAPPPFNPLAHARASGVAVAPPALPGVLSSPVVAVLDRCEALVWCWTSAFAVCIGLTCVTCARRYASTIENARRHAARGHEEEPAEDGDSGSERHASGGARGPQTLTQEQACGLARARAQCDVTRDRAGPGDIRVLRQLRAVICAVVPGDNRLLHVHEVLQGVPRSAGRAPLAHRVRSYLHEGEGKAREVRGCAHARRAGAGVAPRRDCARRGVVGGRVQAALVCALP